MFVQSKLIMQIKRLINVGTNRKVVSVFVLLVRLSASENDNWWLLDDTKMKSRSLSWKKGNFRNFVIAFSVPVWLVDKDQGWWIYNEAFQEHFLRMTPCAIALFVPHSLSSWKVWLERVKKVVANTSQPCTIHLLISLCWDMREKNHATNTSNVKRTFVQPLQS